MNNEVKIRHLLRRFGLGASRTELKEFLALGIDGTIERLIEYERIDEGFPISPWEFCFEEGNDEVYLDPFRPAAWWALRMIITKRPLQEKLTLFWHDHFAVSGTKVEFGPMMLKYLKTLRENANGKFGELLKAVSKDPAMIRYLDTDQSIKGNPNENFARELLELFTLGKGNYSEADVKEAARAFTGWGIRYLVFEQGGENVQPTMRRFIEADRMPVVFAHSPELHDDGKKTVLGKTANFDGDSLLEMLASRNETAAFVSKRLWEFFAYDDPEPAIVNKLAQIYLSTDGDIKQVLYAIARSPEFYSEKCVRKKVKSPVDFTIPLIRQIDLGTLLLPLRPSNAKPTTPLPKLLRDISAGVVFLMNGQGMLLLFPPDVGGWNWGSNWISSDSMSQRIRLASLLFGEDNESKDGGQGLGTRVLLEYRPTTPKQFVDGICDLLDAEVSAEKMKPIYEACEVNGGLDALKDKLSASKMVGAVTTLLFSAPEFQLH
ncbi:MAG: DUF1800 domain-containing protein [Fimbriimonadales bacterium]|nr:DUF1800 domain-containing protein [Fimbriimonadales bacterium]